MEGIKVCKQCGNILSDDQLFCPKCGEKYTEETTPSTPRKSKTPIIIISIVVVTILIVVAIIMGVNISKNNKYEKAIELMQEGKKEEAYDIFSSMGSYKDAEKNATELNNEICYEKALDYLHQGRSFEARDMLDRTVNYSEAESLKKMSTSTIDNVSDDAYFVGAYIISYLTTSSFISEMGSKMNGTITRTFGSDFGSAKQKETQDALFGEQYIKETISWIKTIPETGGDDSKFKAFVMDYYKMRMDYAYGKYVEKNEDYDCSYTYNINAYLILSDKLNLSKDTILAYLNLGTASENTASMLMKGDTELDETLKVSDVLAMMTFFDDVDE